MDTHNPFRNLNFERPVRVPVRPLLIGGTLLAFTVVWWLVPHVLLYWLLLPAVATTLWVATFGWREALRSLQTLLRRLEAA